MVGRESAEPDQGPRALPLEGGGERIEACGEHRPCAAERWQWEQLRLDLTRTGSKILVEGEGETWRTSWHRLDGVLAGCLGDPLDPNPGGDPDGARLLRRETERWTWVLSLAGGGRCGLTGEIHLEVDRDEVDLRGLAVEGSQWDAGGREIAAARLDEAARRDLPAAWPGLTKKERAQILDRLTGDPQRVDLIEILEEIDRTLPEPVSANAR